MTTAIEQRQRVCDIILEQLGGGGLRGAVCYCGGRELSGADRRRDGDERNSFVRDGFVHPSTDGFLQFRVNGKRGQIWTMHVSLELNDTYTVYLRASRGRECLWIEFRGDVYCDELQSVVEWMYDEAIGKRNGGFINIG